MFAFVAASAAVGRVCRGMYRLVVANQYRILCVAAFAVDAELPAGTCIAALTAVLIVECQIDDDAIAFGRFFYAQVVLDIITVLTGIDHAFAVFTDAVFPVIDLFAAAMIGFSAGFNRILLAPLLIQMIAVHAAVCDALSV